MSARGVNPEGVGTADEFHQWTKLKRIPAADRLRNKGWGLLIADRVFCFRTEQELRLPVADHRFIRHRFPLDVLWERRLPLDVLRKNDADEQN